MIKKNNILTVRRSVEILIRLFIKTVN